MGLLWTNTAYAFGFSDILSLFGIQENVPEEVIIIPTPEIVSKRNIDTILPTTKRIILSYDYDARSAGQCVGYVKYITGAEYSGNANTWKQYINSDNPEIGAIIVIEAGRWGHVGIVKEVKEDSVIVRSRNWRSLWQISDDEFKIDDIRILGYIRY